MSYPTYLIHYGIQGQKWGVRRFQNEDGTLTPEGIERYSKLLSRNDKGIYGAKKALDKFESKLDIPGYRNHPSDYASKKEHIRASKRFDRVGHEEMHKHSNEAADRRQKGKDPTTYVKKYANTSYNTALKLVNNDVSEAAQKVMQRYMDMSMNGLNYKMWEIGDFNSYLDKPGKYNNVDYSYDVKNKKLHQNKWK